MFPVSLTRTACRGLVSCLQSQTAPLHSSLSVPLQVSPACAFQPSVPNQGPNDRVTVTLIPGDGVGPEIMDSCQEVLQAMGAKVDFEELYFSEVGNCISLHQLVT